MSFAFFRGFGFDQNYLYLVQIDIQENITKVNGVYRQKIQFLVIKQFAISNGSICAHFDGDEYDEDVIRKKQQ